MQQSLRGWIGDPPRFIAIRPALLNHIAEMEKLASGAAHEEATKSASDGDCRLNPEKLPVSP